MPRRHGPRVTRLLCLCLFNAMSLLPRMPSLAIPANPTLWLGISNSARPARAHRAPSSRQFPHRTIRSSSVTFLLNDLRDEIERSAQRRAYENRSRGGGTGEAVGGAILGGLLGGPFGALFGAQIGASFGAASQLDKARKEEMSRKGLTPEMLEQANDVGAALRQGVEGLRAARESVETSQRLARTLDTQEKSLYERARSAMSLGDEEVARRLLLERESTKEKLLKVLKSVSEDRKRLAIMESNVEALETRALEIESVLRRSVGAASIQDSANMNIGLTLEPEDQLLRKFRDLSSDDKLN
jgi:hypothetical protein